MAVNNEVFNSVRVQQFDELLQIDLQLRQEHSGVAQPTPGECRAAPLVSGRRRTDRQPFQRLQNCRTSERLVPQSEL